MNDLRSISVEKERCTICLMDYEEGEEIKHLSCQHMFHTPCLREWLKNKVSFQTNKMGELTMRSFRRNSRVTQIWYRRTALSAANARFVAREISKSPSSGWRDSTTRSEIANSYEMNDGRPREKGRSLLLDNYKVTDPWPGILIRHTWWRCMATSVSIANILCVDICYMIM